jgi:uncharacterized protein (DUF58 family)
LASLFLTNRFFYTLAGVVVAFVAAYFEPWLLGAARGVGVVWLAAVVVDAALLFASRGEVSVGRETPNRFSNGDPNPVRVRLAHTYPFPVTATVIDELPVQLQVRDFEVTVTLPPLRSREVRYEVRPTERGAYAFGVVNVYTASPLGLLQRRWQGAGEEEVPVYPSFIQMQKYGLLAASNRLEEVGVKKIRRLGHTMEFDHIREYVRGDDYRTINWKATARRGDLMVNEYQDERSQPVYCILNAGRVMKLPFEGMTLLDHSINAALVMSNIALMKHDRAGLITFSHEIGPTVAAERRSNQLRLIQERLYRIETDFLESDYRRLATYVRTQISQRSLLLLFTNFAATSSLERQLPFLQSLAQRHPLVVIFFENTELTGVIDRPARTAQQVYVKGMAEKFAAEKRAITRELNRRGIYTVLTPPEDLSVETINQYLRLKARGVV